MIHKKSIFLLATLTLLYLLLFLTSRSPLIVDDIHPSTQCNDLIAKADILYITPLLANQSLRNNTQWCATIKNLNKTIGLHGIYHTYHEFNQEINPQELQLALDEMQNCFGEKPTLFRPPYNLINSENTNLITTYNLTLYRKRFIQHPYCHCSPHSYMKLLNWMLLC